MDIFFVWIDGKRSILIAKSLDHIQGNRFVPMLFSSMRSREFTTEILSFYLSKKYPFTCMCNTLMNEYG